jgi:hypothetical protein
MTAELQAMEGTMRRTAFLVAAACALTAVVALNGTAWSYAGAPASGLHAPSQAQVTYKPLCEKDSPGLCWRDPSDGGPGTLVVNSGYGTDNARQWVLADDGRCNNNIYVTSTPPCPFTGGSGLNSMFQGRRIVNVLNEGSGFCAGSSVSNQMVMYMHNCDFAILGGELSTVFVVEPFSTHYRLVSVVWSDQCSCAEYVNGSDTNNNPLFIDLAGTYARWIGAGNSGF